MPTTANWTDLDGDLQSFRHVPAEEVTVETNLQNGYVKVCVMPLQILVQLLAPTCWVDMAGHGRPPGTHAHTNALLLRCRGASTCASSPLRQRPGPLTNSYSKVCSEPMPKVSQNRREHVALVPQYFARVAAGDCAQIQVCITEPSDESKGAHARSRRCFIPLVLKDCFASVAQKIHLGVCRDLREGLPHLDVIPFPSHVHQERLRAPKLPFSSRHPVSYSFLAPNLYSSPVQLKVPKTPRPSPQTRKRALPPCCSQDVLAVRGTKVEANSSEDSDEYPLQLTMDSTCDATVYVCA